MPLRSSAAAAAAIALLVAVAALVAIAPSAMADAVTDAPAWNDFVGTVAIQLADTDGLEVDELDAAAATLAATMDARVVRRVGQVRGAYLLRSLDVERRATRGLDTADAEVHHSRLARRASALPSVAYSAVQAPLQRAKRDRETDAGRVAADLHFPDPLFTNQWHLVDTSGRDINVTRVWRDGNTGQGVTVALVDDGAVGAVSASGLDYTLYELASAFCLACSWDYNRNQNYPMPTQKDDIHGTRCAGEIAAAPNNACGVGVAFGAKVAGLRILSGRVTDSMEADALTYKWDLNHIYSNSWGPYDNGATVEGPGQLLSAALESGVKEGRNGRGSIYVFASGNGGSSDNCNFDGYTNSIYTISIGAVGRDNMPASYQEPCVAQLAVTYSSSGGAAITTTDVNQKCTSRFGGTSAAAPLAAGIFALALSARPELTWRDMQWLVVNTTVRIRPEDSRWVANGVGRYYHDYYGFGLLDTWSLVNAAKTWPLVGTKTAVKMPKVEAPKAIPYGGSGLQQSITVEAADTGALRVLEHVEVTVTITHMQRGDLVIELLSPAGTLSTLATHRANDKSSDGLNEWTFTTVRCWGESPLGTWTLVVRDEFTENKIGKLQSWQLTLHGTALEPGAAPPTEPPTTKPGAGGGGEPTPRATPSAEATSVPTAPSDDDKNGTSAPPTASSWLVPALLVLTGLTVVSVVVLSVLRWRRPASAVRPQVQFIPLPASAFRDEDGPIRLL